MGARMGREHHRARLIGLTQSRMPRLVEVKISQAVVDQVDDLLAVPQGAITPDQRSRVGNACGHAMAFEQVLK